MYRERMRGCRSRSRSSSSSVVSQLTVTTAHSPSPLPRCCCTHSSSRRHAGPSLGNGSSPDTCISTTHATTIHRGADCKCCNVSQPPNTNNTATNNILTGPLHTPTREQQSTPPPLRKKFWGEKWRAAAARASSRQVEPGKTALGAAATRALACADGSSSCTGYELEGLRRVRSHAVPMDHPNNSVSVPAGRARKPMSALQLPE